MADLNGGGEQKEITPESFFTGDDNLESQPQDTEETSTEVTESTNGEQSTEEFNGDQWKFKAAGKEYVPKSREELIKWASLGINYDQKARKLNEERAKFLEEKESLTSQQPNAPQQKQEDDIQIDENNPFVDPVMVQLVNTVKSLKSELASIRETAESASNVTSTMTQQQYDGWLDEGFGVLRDELGDGFTPELEEEICLDLQEMMDTIPEERVTSKDGVANLLRSIFYLKHPEGIETVVQSRLKQGLNKTKQINGNKVITEGQAKGAVQHSDTPTSWEEADERAQNLFKGLKEEDFR